MVAHGSPALVLLRFFLPAALLFATCLVFTIPSLLFFVAFLVIHFRPRYEVTKLNFPSVLLLCLTSYSGLLIVAHIVLAILAAHDIIGMSSLAHSLAVPNYKQMPWISFKLLLAPTVVFVCSVLSLTSSTPDGEERYFSIGKQRRSKSSSSDDSSSSSSHQEVMDNAPMSSLDYNDGPAPHITKFTKHMAGRGGIFWTTIACGLTGLSYSSLLTVVFLAVFAFVVVVWAFHISSLHPLRLHKICVIAVKSFRIFVMLYLFFIVSLQNEWFVQFRSDTKPQATSSTIRSLIQLVGFVVLDTSKDEGWAHVTGFCAAVATYVFSGIFVYSLIDLIAARNADHSLDRQELGSADEEPVGYQLSYYETQFLHTVLHLSSLGLLTWSLVFPGLLTLPMMFSALAYFSSKRIRNARIFDKIIVYAILLQIAHFLFLAITTAFDLEKKSTVIVLLGLRSFKPQFTMNLVQALALGLFCTNIFCKRYIHSAIKQGSRSGSQNVPLGFRDFFRNAEFSATAKKQRAMYSTLKVILDQFALSSLYIAAATKATALNSFFIISLCVLCFCQAFGACRRQKIMLFLWTIVLAYTTAFLLITCTVCRAIDLYRGGRCNLENIGVLPASSLEVVAYTVTIVFSAIQVHFTWSAAQTGDDDEAVALEDYRSQFWQVTRKYFLFATYVALLVYPLVFPANFLSYGYVLFLAISILVELLGPLLRKDHQSVRPLIRAYWPTVVFFSTGAVLARYVSRFPFLTSKFAIKWIFGFGRSVSPIQFTIGDASILIIVSLQGRLFSVDQMLKSLSGTASDREAANDRGQGTRMSTFDLQGLPASSAAVHRLSTGFGFPSLLAQQPGAFNRGSLMASESFGQGFDGASRGRHMPHSSFHSDIHGAEIESVSRSVQHRPSNLMRGYPTSRLSAFGDDTSSRKVAIADRERLNQFAQKIRNWRKSLPVKQTEKFLNNAYDYTLAIVRGMLLQYSYVLEACAILAAAVWLPGFSVFGAIYSIMGCILLLSEQASVNIGGHWRNLNVNQRLVFTQNGTRMSKILPVVLSILSFALMSGQYVYSIIAEIHNTGPGYILEYIGFQRSVKTPIDQKAMVAHVLVFVTAFLQRVAVTWDAKDALKISEEEKQAEEFDSILPGALQNQEELAGAVRIGEVLSGVGGFAPAPQAPRNESQRNPSSSFGRESRQSSPHNLSGLEFLGFHQAGRVHSDFSTRVAQVDVPDLDDIHIRSDSSTSTEDVELRKSSSAAGNLSKLVAAMKSLLFELYSLGRQVASLLSPFWEKWGFDLTFMYLVIGGAFTRTFFSVVYVALVMGLSGVRRIRIARHWHHITLLLASLVLLQYFLTLGRPRSSASGQSGSVQQWLQWLYLDAGNKKIERKWDVTFAFLAVICASMTLNAVSPGSRGASYWFSKSLPSPFETSGRLSPENPDTVREERNLDEGNPVKISSLKRRSAVHINTTASDIAVEPIQYVEPRLPARTDINPGDPSAQGNLANILFTRTSGEHDFTQRPMTLKNMIKLGWMRSAGALVQLYMFAAAVVITNLLSGILLLFSFYFMFQFTNVNLKKSKFFIVRFYVLSIVFVLVAYQAPFREPVDWARYIGLFKTENGGTGLVFLYLMVSVWLICQMQGRIYESSSFKYVVKFGEEDAKVRFKRAVHEHNARKYEHMLGRNKNLRARQAREGRLERLKKLKSSTDRSVDALYKVCVVDEMKVLRAKVAASKRKDHIFSSHVRTQKEVLEKETDEGKLRILARFLFRGRSWRKYLSHPLTSELRVFVSRYSGLSVYFTMLLAAVVNPSQLTALYPLVLFLYLILEQPRPPKQVWQFLMCYISIVITGKYVVREVASCNRNFFLPLKGSRELCRISAGIFFEILIFLSLLWHRTVLYYRGLWDLQSTEEDMLLSNEIHGIRVETKPEMVMTELPPLDEEEPVFLSTTSGSFFSKDELPRRRNALSLTSADQQCSDVAEVLKRARESIISLAREAEQKEAIPVAPLSSKPPFLTSEKKPSLSLLDIPSMKKSKALTLASIPYNVPASHSGTPRSTIGTSRPDDLSRFASLRLTGRLRAQEQMEADKNMTESQSRVQKSLVEWKVIPPEKLSLFHSNRQTGFFGGIMNHFAKLTKEQEHKAVGDYYILIFLVDFISFVFVTFGFSSIFNSGSNNKPWWTVNFIEIRHLITLIALFCALVMDRVVYLTRSMKGKLILQYSSVIIYHVVIFYMQQNIQSSFITKAFYMLRCVYFLLSGLQIRNGFPTYTTAQFLLRNYNTPGIVLFEIYMFIPFLWLMRTLLDWAVVPTSLEIFQYFRFVDIYIWLYRNRAVNTARGMFQRKLGQQRRWLPRVYQGFGIFLLCAIALFVPFLFFSVLNPFKVRRDPNQATFLVDLLVPTTEQSRETDVKSAFTIFSRTTFISKALQANGIRSVERDLEIEIRQRDGKFNFLADFGVISDVEWNIPGPAENELLASLGNPGTNASLNYQLSAKTNNQEFKLETRVPLKSPEVSKLAKSLRTRESVALKLNTTFPVYGMLDSGSTTFRFNESLEPRTVCLRHSYSTMSSFWTLQSCRNNCNCTTQNLEIKDLQADRNMFVMEVAIVSGLQVGGTTILTLYGVILFTLASFMRGFFADKRLIIPHIDMPYTLHLYQLVLDIIYSRQDKDLEMEEILYNGLTDIYRDQHVLSKWSGERALKIPREWWLGSEDEEAFFCYPSFSETENEPYMTRIVE